MKKLIYGALIGALLVPVIAGAQVVPSGTASGTAKAGEAANVRLFAVPPKKGERNEAVRDLQQILSNSPAIYPKGLVTGYFGSATESALKRLQAEYAIPVTGVVDEATQNVLVPPQIRLTVLAPNGGETWEKRVSHTIQWESYTGPVMWHEIQVLPATGVVSGSGTGSMIAPETPPALYPMFRNASLDLVRDGNPGFVYHIGTVDLYQSSYHWTIPKDVQAGSDYRVRVSVGAHVPCAWAQDHGLAREKRVCPMYYPTYSASDVSDSTFTISGDVTPNPDTIARLKARVNEMEATLNSLLRQIQTLKDLLARL